MTSNQQRGHTALTIICISTLAMTATVGGCWLLWKGFAGGGELVMTLNTAISGLIGFLGGRNTAAPTTTNINQTKPEGDPVAVVTPIP